MNSQLRILSTGGTFEKTYNPLTGSLGFTQSHLPALIERMRLAQPIATQTLMLIDSLEMQESHRQQILQACAQAPEDRIVIIHGTDTMTDTGKVLGAANLPKTIVLTGAMVPYDVSQSDALFNLGFALGCAQHQSQGVYVAMNARLHPWDKVLKNRAKGVFEGDA
jgi:L-asparaginase